ncbi:phage-encoded membrane protein [Herbaspirillum rubrisubalbicans M1]|uniref:DUF1496 domain-containing protein n=1 Tax=Herbaspirillum rubrisubalbicans TaxID=80842 RepID=UPI00073ACAB6|nr:DUF1496 domain-containing protein [Herbaspirillum rubrisubalbicans]ALU88608.1 phage-encoded membrane protein [Herbaspirillum rubrisubalbicans M1]
MSEKVEVSGDIAQFIGGSVNEAPRQNNVVNFHLGTERAIEEKLTELQRKRISELVKQLCASTQEEPLDIYRVILTDFGAERMKDMPRTKYHAIVSQLRHWIHENNDGAQKIEEMPTLTSPSESLRESTSSSQQCRTCAEKDSSYTRLLRLSRGQWILLGILSIAVSLLLYMTPNDSFSSTNDRCFYDGKPYSAGSVIKLVEETRECAPNTKVNAMEWKPSP